MIVFTPAQIFDLKLKHKDQPEVVGILAALQDAYQAIAKLPEECADLRDENRRFEDKIIEMGSVVREARELVTNCKLDIVASRTECERLQNENQTLNTALKVCVSRQMEGNAV